VVKVDMEFEFRSTDWLTNSICYDYSFIDKKRKWTVFYELVSIV